MNDLTHLSLFTGIGGIDIAAQEAGFRTVGQVEQNKYANQILRKRFGRKIPRWTDIRDLSAEDFKRRTGINSPTLISGGFPCQPFSCAGKRRGKEDDRHLWPEMFRVVRKLRSAWVLGENVAGIVNMELESCCADLEGEGYTIRAFLIPACGVGALHRRERVFIVAHSNNTGSGIAGLRGNRDRGEESQRGGRITRSESGTLCEDVAYSSVFRRKDGRGMLTKLYQSEEGVRERENIRDCSGWFGRYWDVEPAVGRVAHGVSHRVDRLRCLGNAVVPQQVYPILTGIAQIEKEMIIGKV